MAILDNDERTDLTTLVPNPQTRRLRFHSEGRDGTASQWEWRRKTRNGPNFADEAIDDAPPPGPK